MSAVAKIFCGSAIAVRRSSRAVLRSACEVMQPSRAVHHVGKLGLAELACRTVDTGARHFIQMTLVLRDSVRLRLYDAPLLQQGQPCALRKAFA